MEQLGLDRPAYFFVVNGVALQGEDGGRLVDVLNPYPTVFDANLAAASAARGAGLVEEVGGRWRLTDKGRDAAATFRKEVDAYYTTLAPLPRDEITKLAILFAKALASIEASDVPKDHLRRMARYGGDPKIPMSALDRALFGLWQARDDCHMSSWRDAGFDGPTFDVLTRVWRTEADSDETLATKLPGQRPDDVRRALERLRDDGLVERGALRVTTRGGDARQRIEDDTDRRFFGPWPDDVGREAKWMVERLTAINTALAPAS